MPEFHSPEARIKRGNAHLGDFNIVARNGLGSGAEPVEYHGVSDLEFSEALATDTHVNVLNDLIYTAHDENTPEALRIGLVAQYLRDEYLLGQSEPNYERGKHLSVREYLQQCAKDIEQAGEPVPQELLVSDEEAEQLIEEAERIVIEAESLLESASS